MIDTQYKHLVETVLNQGVRKTNRTGVDTLSYFNYNYSHDLSQGFPLLTTKEISWKNIVVELLWFLAGEDDGAVLEKHGCKFWRPWYSKDKKVTAGYGPNWRKFGGVNDQLAFVVDQLVTNPNSRRMVVSAWDPSKAQTVPLPPCHCMYIFNVQDGKLCCHLTQRSADIGLGVPYNIASYALLTHLLAHITGLQVGEFAHTLVDAHIYTCSDDGTLPEDYSSYADHVPPLTMQVQRDPYPLPTISISGLSTLAEVSSLVYEDTDTILSKIQLKDYQHHPKVRMDPAK